MQKIFYLSILFISISMVSNAQISQGSLLLGGDLSFNSQNTRTPQGSPSNYNATTVTLDPSIGKAIKDNLVLGLILDYSHYSTNSENPGVPNTVTDYNTYGAGVYLRKYFPVGKNFSVFTEGQINGSYQRSSENGLVTERNHYLTLDFIPGVVYALTPRVQLEVALPDLFTAGYSHIESGPAQPQAEKTNNFSVGTGLSSSLQDLEIGVKFLLGHRA